MDAVTAATAMAARVMTAAVVADGTFIETLL
jgi:hypothetical protein